MEFRDYVRIIRQRGWLIIVLALLVAAGAFGYSRMQTPVYEASARLLITTRPDFGQTQSARLLLRDYAAWLRSSYRAADVIEQLQLDMVPSALAGDVTVAAGTSESIIQIDVESTDPDLARDIARVWAELLIQRRERENVDLRQEDRIEAELIDDPTVALARPNTKINTVAGAVFGALLGLIIIFALEWIASGVLRRPEDIERHLEIPVVGSIPHQ
jgi:capsular polysaccharide biosynthesis protein